MGTAGLSIHLCINIVFLKTKKYEAEFAKIKKQKRSCRQNDGK
jgi:hypothetical protein